MIDRETHSSLFGRFGLLGWGLAFFFLFFGARFVPWSPMANSRTIESQLTNVFGNDSQNPQVLRAWRGKSRILCGNIVKFTSKSDVFATRFIAEPDGSDAIARDFDEDNSTIVEWEERLGTRSTNVYSNDEIRAALAEIEERNATFDKKWAKYCVNDPA
jgi:hypothetical protein